MKLQKKVVVITGASKGLGKALATELIREGSSVIISARSKNELKNTALEIGATAYSADVTKEKDVLRLARFAQRRFGRIDIWVNNAGITMPRSSIEKINSKAAHHVMEVNFFGTFFGTRAAISTMKKGVLVNIISNSSLVGRPRSLVYSASKWAVRGFTEGVRMTLKPRHILVIAVHPGGMKTTIFGKHLPKGYEGWMEPAFVAKKLIRNLKLDRPKEELIITQ